MTTATSRRFAPRTLAAALLLVPLVAFATPPIDQFGSLAITCAGLRTGNGVPVQNIDLPSLFQPGNSVCKEAFSSAMAKVKAKAHHSADGVSTGSGAAQAMPGGKLSVRTSNSTTDNGDSAGAIAGFTDVLMIDAPEHTGTSGILYYRVKVKGSLETHGLAGQALFRILPLVPHLTTTWRDWHVQTDWSLPDAKITVDETVVVSANFVFGQPLNLTTVAWAISGGGNTHGSVDFDGKNAVQLKGVDHITTYFGVPVTDYSLSSQSGLNWTP